MMGVARRLETLTSAHAEKDTTERTVKVCNLEYPLKGHSVAGSG